MSTAERSHLTLLAPPDWSLWGRDVASATLVRRKCVAKRTLLRRLDQLCSLAPSAPLSCLAIDISVTPPSASMDAAMEIVTEQLLFLTRPTDVVGQIDEEMLGVILQGTGAAAASAVAARLQYRLNEIEGLRGRLHAIVGTATGTGENGRTLLEAAMRSFDDAC